MALSGSNDAVERAIFGLCGALSGSVTLEPSSSVSSGGSGPSYGLRPLPRIVVRFASNGDSDQDESADQLPLVLRRLEAVGALSAVAGCEAFTWRRSPLFWLHVLQHCCQVRNCDEYFDPRAISCADAAVAAAAREKQAHPRSQVGPRSRKAANQRAVVAAFLWQQEEGSQHMYRAREYETPCFVLDFSYVNFTPEVLSALRRFLMARAKARKPTWRFSYIKTMNLLGSVARPIRVLPIEVALRFNRCRLRVGMTLTALRDLLSDVNQRHERSRNVVSPQTRFVPTGASKQSQPHGQVDVTPSEWEWLVFAVTHLDVSASQLKSKDFARLADIVARSRGSPLRELVLNQVFVGASSAELLPTFGSLMSECFRTSPTMPTESGCAGNGQNDREGSRLIVQSSIRHLSLAFNALTEFHLASLFSSIHCGGVNGSETDSDGSGSVCSNSVRILSLQDAFRGFQSDRSRPWLWLAFGIFHAQSQSQITHLNLSRNVLRPEAVRAVKILLDSSSTPYADIFARKKSSGKRRSRSDSSSGAQKASGLSDQCALLAASTNLWTSPERKARKVSTSVTTIQQQFKTRDECWCHVLSLGSKWACLLVPGYGRFWAKSSQILRLSVPPGADLDTKKANGVKLTTLEMSAMASGEEDVAVRGALVPFIQTVGRSLLALHLRSNTLLESDLAVILESCPALKLLDVEDCELQGIRPLIAGYANGSCSIETLNLAENSIPTRDIVDLSRELRSSSDRTSDTARITTLAAVPPLAVLHLELNLIERVSLQSLLRVVASGNRTLRLLTLDRVQDADRELEYRFAQFNGEDLCVYPLSPSHRAALVSIAQAIPSVQRCDGPVLALIADFAAERVRRQIVWK